MKAAGLIVAALLAAGLAGAAGPTAAQAPAPAVPAAPPAAAPPGQSSATARPTLIPQAGDPVNVDEVVLPDKPVLALAGSSKWDEGLKNLRSAFARIEGELGRLGMAPAGRPLVLYTMTTEEEFRYEAMIPVGQAPEPSPAVAAEMRFGRTPSGKAYRFVHQGPYDDVDSTYEIVTTYLDAKDIVARDQFLEEFLNDVADPNDPGLELNIFVQPR